MVLFPQFEFSTLGYIFISNRLMPTVMTWNSESSSQTLTWGVAAYVLLG